MTATASSRTSAHGLVGRWFVVPEVSEARFHVRDKLVTTVHGSLPVEQGGAAVSTTGGLGEVWVELTTAGIATGNAHRDRDVRKPAFLDAAAHPTVRVSIEEATETSAGWVATAVLCARGASAPVELVIELVIERVTEPVTELVDSADDIRVRVTGRLDRRPLGMRVPTVICGRFLDLEADLTFRRVPATS